MSGLPPGQREIPLEKVFLVNFAGVRHYPTNY
jgi:hypothetical protein